MKRVARRTPAIVHKSDNVDYKNIDLLVKCLGPQGQILSRRRTGLTNQRQRDLKQAIKRARHLGLLPFVG
jgi:small subunit ribosomal protein S18